VLYRRTCGVWIYSRVTGYRDLGNSRVRYSSRVLGGGLCYTGARRVWWIYSRVTGYRDLDNSRVQNSSRVFGGLCCTG
jgi:hypothetical protein